MQDNEAYWDLARAAQLKAARYRRRATPRPSASDDSLTMHSPTQRQGRRVEERASRYLQDQGLIVLARNLRCKAGEIDLVCLDRDTLVFVEVRQRQSSQFGGAAASVNRAKQWRLSRAAAYFLPRLQKQHIKIRSYLCRFDVVAVDDDTLQWIKAAFAVQPMR